MNYVKLKLRLPAPVRLAFQLNFTSSLCQNLSKLTERKKEILGNILEKYPVFRKALTLTLEINL